LSTLHFYRDIKALELPIAEVMQSHHFSDVPNDWCVIIADVQNSTAAVAAGRHNDVNLIAAGSLIAVLNIAKEKNIEIPFFFSGDGGAVLVPEEMKTDVLIGLLQHNENTNRNFGLNMHIGSLSIHELVDAGATVKIAKVELGQSFHKALIIGDGLKFAERKIKLETTTQNREQLSSYILNMSGLECRWDKVKPPGNENENEIVCYLIEACDQKRQAEVYRDVLLTIDETYGSIESRNPLSISRLKLLISLNKVHNEMEVKFGRWKITYFIITFLETFLGLFFFRFNLKLGAIRANEYLAQLVANADTLTIDGRINTILSGKTENRKQLLHYLSKKENEGTLLFGHHHSKESIMTCYIEDRDSKHIHFIDGSDGGYTEAAKMLKQKIHSYDVQNARSGDS
jgi:hypothetical protein